MDIKSIVDELNPKLKYGDKWKIMKSTGLSRSVVYQFFEKADYKISQESAEKIINAACLLIESRKSREERIKRAIAQL